MPAPRPRRPLQALALAGGALALAACAPFSEYSPVNVTAFRGIKIEKNGCFADSVNRMDGRLASKFGTDFWIGVEIRSELSSNENASGRENSMNVLLEKVSVTYASPDGSLTGVDADTHELEVAIMVPSNGTSVSPVPLITTAVGKKLNLLNKDGVLRATMILSGKTFDGTPIETTPVSFPVELDSKLFAGACVAADGSEVDPVFACGMDGTPDAYQCPVAQQP